MKPPFAKMVTFDPMTTSPSPKAPVAGMAFGSSTSTSGYEMKQLMTEALEELRKLKSVDVKTGTFLAAMDENGKKGLLNSGATHPLRPAILDELERAQKVKVCARRRIGRSSLERCVLRSAEGEVYPLSVTEWLG